jgi:lipoprotein-releasing system permease protein
MASYSSFIGSRYLRSRKKRSISVIGMIAILGVALGVASLSVVIAISSGFQDEFTDKVLGVNAHLLVMKYGVDFTEYRDVIKKAKSLHGVRGAAPFVIQEMMIAKGKKTASVLLKGVDPTKVGEVLDLPTQLVDGGLKGLRIPGSRPPSDEDAEDESLEEKVDKLTGDAGDGAASAEAAQAEAGAPADPDAPLPGIVVGKALAEILEAKVGDKVQVTTPLIGLDMFEWSPTNSTPTSLTFEIIGIFYAGFLEYDTKLAYVDYYQAQRFFEYRSEKRARQTNRDTVTGVELTLHDRYAAKKVGRQIKRLLGRGPYHTVDWMMLNEPLFTALKIQKAALVMVLAIIVGVAAFNIIATLVMMVFDKKREIAILKSMGATHGGIARVFLHVGLVVGIIGIAIGLTVGFGVCLLLDRVGWPLDPSVYLIDHLPVRLEAMDFVLTAGIAFIICQLATILPALSASKLRPVEGLRQD